MKLSQKPLVPIWYMTAGSCQPEDLQLNYLVPVNVPFKAPEDRVYVSLFPSTLPSNELPEIVQDRS